MPASADRMVGDCRGRLNDHAVTNVVNDTIGPLPDKFCLAGDYFVYFWRLAFADRLHRRIVPRCVHIKLFKRLDGDDGGHPVFTDYLSRIALDFANGHLLGVFQTILGHCERIARPRVE